MDAESPTLVKLGWLWFDDDPKASLAQKLERAARRYRQKFGREAHLCYVSRGTLSSSEETWGSLRLVSAGNVLPGHFLFVVENGQ